MHTHGQFWLTVYLYSTTQTCNYCASDTCGFQFYCKMVVNTKHTWILPHSMIRHLCPVRAEMKVAFSSCPFHRLPVLPTTRSRNKSASSTYTRSQKFGPTMNLIPFLVLSWVLTVQFFTEGIKTRHKDTFELFYTCISSISPHLSCIKATSSKGLAPRCPFWVLLLGLCSISSIDENLVSCFCLFLWG